MFDAAVVALGGESTQTDVALEQGVSPEELEPIRGAHILLAEDNALNQQVASELLTDSGFIVDVAENGEETLRMLAEEGYDVVLMDVHMPIMDGLVATKKIREQEKFADLPILAMTAGAMQSDKDQCDEAGMNDHIVKPIDPAQLFGTLVKWIKPGERQSAEASEPTDDRRGGLSSAQPPDHAFDDAVPSTPTNGPAAGGLETVPGLDVEAGVKRVMGKRDFYDRLVRDFITGEEAMAVENVRRQLADGDREAAERTAHSLKGVAGTLGADELQKRAAELETGIKDQRDESEIESFLESVGEEMVRLSTAIKNVLEIPVKDQPSFAKAADLSPDVVAKLPELVTDLKERESLIPELQAGMSINDIESFAGEICALGKTYAYPPLIEWGEHLNDAAQMFDMDKIGEQLGEFDQLSKAIEEIL